MSNQYPQQPQQPNWGQQPTQPGYGYPQQPGYPQPQPPKKRSIGKILGIVAASFVGLIVIAAIAGGGDDSKDASSKDKAVAVSSDKPKAAADDKAADEPAEEAPAEAPVKEEKTEKPKPKVVTFKVWGTAPAGALGPLDVNYGSDSDSRKGDFKDGKFEATLPLNDEAMYFNVTAQLQGSGDINCSVTVDGETKSAHASGDYNICNAQLSSGLFGSWS